MGAQRNANGIEDVSDGLLRKVIEDNEFVAVLFSGSCADEDAEECETVRENLEEIDTVFDDYGVVFVATHELGVAKENKVKRFPAFGLFKNEQFIKYEGEVSEETAVLTWALSPETLDLPGEIEEVNAVMLATRLKEEEHLIVFFYEEGSIYAQRLLKELEVLDDKLDKNNIKFFKICDDDIDKDYDLEDMPALLYFHKT